MTLVSRSSPYHQDSLSSRGLEKRKAWIYEVPLTAVHHLRESLNAVPPEQPIPADVVTKYDAPVLTNAVKLWLLELDPPIALWEGWEDLRRLYPNGARGRELYGV
jgi:hypothetical protein